MAKKNKGTKKTDSMRRTVTLDGVTIQINLAPMRNLRLIRRIKHEDMSALFTFIEGLFGAEQLNNLEEQFGLSDVLDYQEFIKRVMEEVSPNS